MKIYNLLVLSIISLFIVASCTSNPQPMEKEENSDAKFKQMCQDSNYEWMFMKPTKDGKIVKEAEPCWGCMIGGIEHICDMNQFSEMT